LTAVAVSRFDSWLMFFMVAILALSPGPGAAPGLPQGASGVAVTCQLDETAGGGVYRLSQADEGGADSWTLSMRRRTGPARWIRLALPNARPLVGDDTFQLHYRNANGGRQIDIEVSPAGATLDVYVDYGLDVNIEPDLDPDVDQMNTQGPTEALTCTIDHH
jgi:hypothetical protein